MTRSRDQRLPLDPALSPASLAPGAAIVGTANDTHGRTTRGLVLPSDHGHILLADLQTRLAEASALQALLAVALRSPALEDLPPGDLPLAADALQRLLVETEALANAAIDQHTREVLA